MPDTFYKMTFGHFQLYAEGYQIREARQWERARFISTSIFNSVGSAMRPTDLFKLHTDHQEQEPAERLTTEQIEEVIKRFDSIKNWGVA